MFGCAIPQTGTGNAANGRAAKFAGFTLTIAAKAGSEGKLFGSVGTRDIAEAITAAGVTVDKSEVRLPNGPFKAIGEYDIEIALHHDVVAPIKVVVVGQA